MWLLRTSSADTLSQYSEKKAQRALSELAMLSDSAFAPGVDRMKRDVEEKGSSGPTMESMDLFVFEKVADE